MIFSREKLFSSFRFSAANFCNRAIPASAFKGICPGNFSLPYFLNYQHYVVELISKEEIDMVPDKGFVEK